MRPDAKDLISCFQDTLKFSLEGPLGEKDRAGASRIYSEGTVAARLYRLSEPEILVEESTSFASARRHRDGGTVAVLNFANPHYPGGGVAQGAMAQEECLCRSSDLYACLSREENQAEFYRYHREQTDYFFSHRLIYTKGVTVFKDDAPLPRLLPREEWFQVDVITCAAPYLAQRKYTNRAVLGEIFRERITNILEAAIDNGAEVLILGAFGCGAFGNPPEIVAKAFWDVLMKERYRGAFRRIVFAVKSSRPDCCPNLAAFRQMFGSPLEGAAPWPLEGILPSVRLPGGRILQTGEQIRAFRFWQRSQSWHGKQFSILGDSLSALAGYIPRGYHAYDSGGIENMEDTWWGKFLDFFGGELLVNNAWSGSTVAVRPGQNQVFPAGCSKLRAGGLHTGIVLPEVILIAAGMGDWLSGLPLEEKPGENHLYSFRGAYRAMVETVAGSYPEAEVWCCTLSRTYMAENPDFCFPEAYGGTPLEAYNRVIRSCAEEFGCGLLALEHAYDSTDGTHPTAQGMEELAVSALLALGNPQIRGILGIPEESEPEPQLPQEPPKAPALKLRMQADGRAAELDGEKCLAGRSPDCDLQLKSPYAARYQATFLREGENWFLRDNNSRNGTFVNGLRLAPGENVQLRQGDKISFARMEEAEVL